MRSGSMDALTAAASILSMDVDSYAVEYLHGGDRPEAAAGAAASEAVIEANAVEKENITGDDVLCDTKDAAPKVRHAKKLPCKSPYT